MLAGLRSAVCPVANRLSGSDVGAIAEATAIAPASDPNGDSGCAGR
jgi:hypothetical protein